MKHNIITFIAFTAMLVVGFIFWNNEYVFYFVGVIAVLYVASTIYGSFTIQSNYFLTSLNKGPRNSITLTFDDGPHPELTPKILAVLNQYQVKATFFVIGKNAEQYPDLVKRIVNEGHIVANHSYSHHHFIGFFSRKRLEADIEKCNQIIFDLTGKRPAYFRPPFGVTNPRYADVLKKLNMQSIGWSLRSLDTQAKNKYELIQRILSKICKGDIILLHDNQQVAFDALDDIIEHGRNKKLPVESLDWVTKTEPYALS